MTESIEKNFWDGVWHDHWCQFHVCVESIIIYRFDCILYFIVLALFLRTKNETSFLCRTRLHHPPWGSLPPQPPWSQPIYCTQWLHTPIDCYWGQCCAMENIFSPTSFNLELWSRLAICIPKSSFTDGCHCVRNGVVSRLWRVAVDDLSHLPVHQHSVNEDEAHSPRD